MIMLTPNGCLTGNIYYASRQSGSWQIWRCRTDGTEEEMITKDGAYKPFPFVSDEGEYLFYTRFKEKGLWKIDLKTRIATAVLSPSEMEDKINWTVNEKGVYYYFWENGGCYLRFFDFETSSIKNVVALYNIVPGVPGLAVSNDGEILVATSDKIRADLVKVKIEVVSPQTVNK